MLALHLRPIKEKIARFLLLGWDGSAIGNRDRLRNQIQFIFGTYVVRGRMGEHSKSGRLRAISVLAILLAVASIWQWNPIAGWIDAETVSAWVRFLREHPMAPLVAIAAYLFGSVILFPLILLIGITIFVYGPVLGFLYSLLGSVMAAILTYGIGYGLGHQTVRQIAGSHMDRVRQVAAKHGLMVALITHLVPVAPFTIVNLIAGASRIGLRDFVLGTVLGMLPGIVTMALFQRQLESLVRDRDLKSFMILGALAGFAVVGGIVSRRYLIGPPAATRLISETGEAGDPRRQT